MAAGARDHFDVEWTRESNYLYARIREQKKVSRISEAELTIPVLRHLSQAPNGFLTTTDLIRALEEEFDPSGEDAMILEGRSDSRFTQIVRNIVSHRTSSGDMVYIGLVTYDPQRKGLSITTIGRNFLNDHS